MLTAVHPITDLTRNEYDYVRHLVYAKSGINLGNQKMQLVRSRLGKILRERKFTSFREYFDVVANDASGEELSHLLDAISTNTTFLFREIKHFQFLDEILKRWSTDMSWRSANPAVRIWSAACSSGDEPYSIAMVADSVLGKVPGVALKLLATDLSTRMLSRARLGIFDEDRVRNVPAEYRSKYLHRLQDDDVKRYQVIPALREKVTFSRFNLMSETFPFKHGFHVVFCRNVMIYFDKATQETLVNKLAGQIRPGGYLMIGHSESLNGIHHPLKYVAPTIYQRVS